MMRIWTRDNMNWVEVPVEPAVGDVIKWAGQHWRVVNGPSVMPAGIKKTQFKEREPAIERRAAKKQKRKSKEPA